ncbi:MAG: glycosyltransferase family 2 protein [Myxococcales bacterium FL481]|nr:MAG: glycosyltransferase family 2 protein [Myxococcales bacterium FL481]
MPKVLLSMVTWKAADITIDCIASIESEIAKLDDAHLVVVDNDSGDGSAEKIEAAIEARGWDRFATLVRSGKNGGFAYGHNCALRADLAADSPADYAIMLNPDMIILPGAFTSLVEFMESHPRAGMAGARSQDEDGTVHSCSFRFPGVANEFASYARVGAIDRVLQDHIARMPVRQDAHQVDWVSGACVIVRREVLEQVGLLDETFFLYYEETDWMLRAKRLGWEIWHVPAAKVVHFVGHATNIRSRNDERPGRRPQFWFESRRHYYVKNFGRGYAALTDAAATAGILLWRLKLMVKREKNMDPPHLLRDLVRNGVAPPKQRRTGW